jgi:hypothetical protein
MTAPEPARRPAARSRGGDPAPGIDVDRGRPGEPHPLAALQETFGNLGVVRRLADPAVQARLEIGAPDDDYEREADRVAASIMRRPHPVAASADAQEEGGPAAPARSGSGPEGAAPAGTGAEASQAPDADHGRTAAQAGRRTEEAGAAEAGGASEAAARAQARGRARLPKGGRRRAPDADAGRLADDPVTAGSRPPARAGGSQLLRAPARP